MRERRRDIHGLTALAWLLTLHADLLTRRRRCPHSMVQMADGPVCRLCGQSWVWRRAGTE